MLYLCIFIVASASPLLTKRSRRKGVDDVDVGGDGDDDIVMLLMMAGWLADRGYSSLVLVVILPFSLS